jgi:quinoprotein glucose dehydrogenase
VEDFMALPSRRNVLLASAASLVAAQVPAWAQAGIKAPSSDTDWRSYGGNLAYHRYSPLEQITAENFSDLEVAWRFKTDSLGARPEYKYETTPLVIKGRMYSTAGSRRDVVCLDAATGEMRWMYSLDEGARGAGAPRQLSGHGVSYWADGKDERILYVTPGYRLIALDARTGIPVKGFGVDGIVDLKQNDDQKIDLVTGEVGLHATPLVAGNTVIVGAAHLQGDVPKTRTNVKGYVRGFDARTGKRKWIFHTIPRKGEFGYDTWTVPGQAEQAGNTGCWSQVAADLELGLAYLPIELPTGDQVGIYRQGSGLFGETLVAVDIETGKRKWHYQTIHHGLWDRDIPCAAILCDIPHNGKMVKALAQPSKQSFLYVLNRETGEPIWPIPEMPAEAGDVPGEWYSPTQPIPSKPPAYDVQSVNPDTVIDFTPELHAKALELISHYKTGTIYVPPTMASLDGRWGTLSTPASQGGTNFPGGAYDPENYMVYVFSETLVQPIGIVKGDPKFTEFAYVHGVPGQATRQYGAMGSAEQAQRGGGEGAPAARRRTAATRGPGAGGPNGMTVDGLPLMKPPYGRITAIDLTKGDIAWQIAHGETPDYIRNHPALKGITIPRTGQPGLLGPLATKTLVICGEPGFTTTQYGVRGAMLRAYDKKTGVEKGAVYMPAPQTGTPMTYMLGGQQYLVVAIGGGNYSAELVAYRLPRA